MTPESPVSPPRRTWAEINLSALRHNAAFARQILNNPEVRIMAIVKANAYGHGIGPVVKALADQVQMFGVANVAEARELRKHLPSAEVLILGPALPEERAEIVADRFIPSISNEAEAQAFGELAGNKPLVVHLVIDTGMGRIGVWQEEAAALVKKILAIPGVKVTGVASHLPVADEDQPFTLRQITRFNAQVVGLRNDGLEAPIVHIENSAGVIQNPIQAGDMVRPGIMLYGFSPMPQWQHCLQPVLTWKTRVALLREVGGGRSISYGRTFVTPRAMLLATLPVGYADGYRRHLSGQNAYVLIRGRRCPVLGRVTMDQVVVDASVLADVEVGDEVVLIGKQGTDEIFVGDLAKKSGTIAWEIFTGIGQRVERVYVGG